MVPGVPPPPRPPAREGRSSWTFVSGGPRVPPRAPWGPHSDRGRDSVWSAGPPARAWARPISAARLRASRPLHLPPINQVFSLGPYQKGGPVSGRASRLRCLQRLSRRARLPGSADGRRPVHRRPVRPGPLVLGAAPLSPPAPAEDRDRTVSRRSEPSSRTALIGEQPNPWDLLQPRMRWPTSRCKPSRRCGLLGKISLLSPEYLLSVERRPSHAGPPDH